MPQVAVAAAGAAISGAIAGATVGAILANVALSVVLAGVSMALAPKPKKSSGSFQQNTVAVRQPAVTRKLVYGQTRISDVYAHIASSNNNEFLHLLIILAGHELTEIGEVWADDYCIPPDWLDADGNVTQGKYAGVMRIRKHLGSDTQTADPFLINEVPDWTAEHRLQGIAYLYVRLKYDANKFPNGEPSFSAIVKGRALNDPRTGLGFSTNAVLFVNDYLRDPIFGYGAVDVSMDDINVAAEANIADEMVDSAEIEMTVSAINTSTNIIKLNGDRLLYEIGDRCRVTSTGTLPGGLSDGTDYFIIPYQFKDVPRILLATSLAAAMSGIAIDLTSAGSGTIKITKNAEPRYHGGGIIDSGSALKDNIQALLTGIAGRATNIGGKWRILSGAWRSPDITLSYGDLREAISMRTKIAMSERFNLVKGLYISQLNDYQQADYPPVFAQAFFDQDAGVKYPRDLNLPVTNRSETAQRIGKIELLRARQEIMISVSASLKAMQIQAGDTLMLDFSRYGFESKIFEVIDLQLSVSQGDVPTVLVNLTLRETAEGIYTWSLEEAALVDPAPNTTLQNVFDVQVPTGVSFNSRQIDTRDGDALFGLYLSWDLHPDAFVRERGGFVVQWKKSSETDWQPSFFVDGQQTESFVLQSSVNVAYDLRIAARNNLGVQSSWVVITGAVAGSSGGVGTTNNWQTFQDLVTLSQDWGTFSDVPTSSEDWGYFT